MTFADIDLDARFTRDGFIIADLLSPRDITILTECFEQFADHHGQGFSATILSTDTAYRADAHTALAPLLVSRLASLLVDYRPACSGFAVKRGAGIMPLHQDITMVPRDGRTALSVWIPLVPVDAHNACLQVVPGSHQCDYGPRAPGTPFVLAHHEARLRASHLVSLPMEAGQVLVMHPALFHASDVNHSAHARPVVAAPFVPDESPLVYYHRRVDATGQATLEGFDVDAAFYLTHRLGTAPTHARPIHIVSEAAAPAEFPDALPERT